jgi:hypothetical protein
VNVDKRKFDSVLEKMLKAPPQKRGPKAKTGKVKKAAQKA